MTIVPRGRRRDQVNQGAYKNASVLTDDIIDKLAQARLGEESPFVDTQQTTQPSRELQQTMDEGARPGMRDDGQSQMDGQVPPIEEEGAVEPAPAAGGDGYSVTDEGQKMVQKVQQALGLDPLQWTGKSTIENGPDGNLNHLVIDLTKAEKISPGGQPAAMPAAQPAAQPRVAR